jgi:hypothetical protein
MPAIQQLRCTRHQEREAAARCVLCENFFCRECVTEHNGKMLCAKCLRIESAPRKTAPRTWHRIPLQIFLAFCSTALLWLIFYGASQLLLTIPDRFHQGILPPKEAQAP